MTDLKNRSPVRQKPKTLIRSLFYNCLALVVIFTLCLYGLGVMALYMRWFMLDAPPSDTPTPIIVTVVLPTDPGTDQTPIIITVVATRPPEQEKPPTATLDPTPTQWWPPTTTAEITYTMDMDGNVANEFVTGPATGIASVVPVVSGPPLMQSPQLNGTPEPGIQQGETSATPPF